VVQPYRFALRIFASFRSRFVQGVAALPGTPRTPFSFSHRNEDQEGIAKFSQGMIWTLLPRNSGT